MQIRGAVSEMFDTLAPEMQGFSRVVLSNLCLFGPLVLRDGTEVDGATVATANGHGMMWGPAVSRTAVDVTLAGRTDVVEHVDDYVGFVRALGAKARHVIFNIPLDVSVINILLRRFDDLRVRYGHLHYFTRETALATLEYAGLKVRTEFLANGGIARATTAKKRLAAIPRVIVGAISQELSCRLMGGCSLVVVADGY